MEATTGAQIKKFRIARKMTQAELAGKIGCATITIRQYENNSRTPGIVTMQKLAFALKCRIEDLMGLETFDTGEELMSRIKEIDESSGGESLTVIHTTDPRYSVLYRGFFFCNNTLYNTLAAKKACRP